MSHKLVSLYIGDGEYYTKTDADAVIAEKDEEIYNIKYSRDEWAKACNQKDEEIAELKAKLEEAGMRERRLKRALLLMCARLGKMGHLAFHSIWAKLFYLGDEEGMCRANIRKDQWKNVERKCRALAELYKEAK